MRMKALIAAAAITAFTGSAFAQMTGATEAGEGEAHGAWTSEHEQLMFEERREMLGGFYTDETFVELAPEADFQASWDAMSAEQQAEAIAVCEQVQGAPTEYRNVTVQMCDNMDLL